MSLSSCIFEVRFKPMSGTMGVEGMKTKMMQVGRNEEGAVGVHRLPRPSSFEE
jgi:hypothetical protein